MSSEPAATKPLSSNEGLKAASHFLRGTIAKDIQDGSTGAISEENSQLTKFHGLYLQDDRDVRKERVKLKQEKAYGFMLRVRLPGGRCTAEQYLMLDTLADQCANGSLRLTTRQTFQFHGVLKGNLKPLIRGMHKVLLDSIAACGDVNRNVMAPPNPERSAIHQQVYEAAKAWSQFALPKTRAYHEIWIDDELVAGGEPKADEEPMYGPTYLPRKFKTGFAVPPSNDVDIYSQDLGFIAIVEDGKLVGYNVAAGGGMGMSHGNAETFPRLADIMGFVTPDKVNTVGHAVLTTQRDFGDRSNRKHARLKYTIQDRGIEWFRGEVERRIGFKFEPARPFNFTTISDEYGWHRAEDGTWYHMLFILSGRIKDSEGWQMRTCLREIAKVHQGDFRLTPSQNLSISGITDEQKPVIEGILKKYNLNNTNQQSGMRLNALSCVALPTCGLALAESERALPGLLDRFETVLDENGLHDEPISLRVTGCPNGCARPFLAEIALVGKAPNKYALYLGAKFDGTRLNQLYAPSATIDEIFAILTPMIKRFVAEREAGEKFGDFTNRVILPERAAALAAAQAAAAASAPAPAAAVA
ncbi:MAG TPA: NADPH-dependent assimilatory sulfite reductase hemoprotein subunit [Opitutaceae bacterium]|nr:NADPH-dependent assimilatory sulfite reductase hemoprotein subunit [Opitutaceae bacterium]